MEKSTRKMTIVPRWRLDSATPVLVTANQENGMRIYEVTFDGRTKGEPNWGARWDRVKVAVEDGSALAAIELATAELPTGETFETRPAEVAILAET